MILLVCAVNEELRHYQPRPHVEMLVTGVGPVEASIATTRALAISPPQLVVNAGIAGGFRGRAAVGDALAIESDRFADLGLEDRTAFPPLPGGTQLTAHAESDPALVRLAREAGMRVGRALTVATVTTSDARARKLAEVFDADVEAMEGFAVLRAAAAAAIPALELRAVSNLVGPRETSGWDFDAGARALATLVDRVLDALPQT